MFVLEGPHRPLNTSHSAASLPTSSPKRRAERSKKSSSSVSPEAAYSNGLPISVWLSCSRQMPGSPPRPQNATRMRPESPPHSDYHRAHPSHPSDAWPIGSGLGHPLRWRPAGQKRADVVCDNECEYNRANGHEHLQSNNCSISEQFLCRNLDWKKDPTREPKK